MNALTVHFAYRVGEIWPSGIELRCRECGRAVATWPSGVELADVGAAEQDHAAEHVAALGGVS